MRSRWPLLALTFLTVACSDDNETTAPTGQNNVPGATARSVSVGGVPRTFSVYVGSTVGANTNAPVVFMLHGTSGNGPQFLEISGWKEKADAEGLIAVFPSALTYCFFEDENGDHDFDDAGERKITTKWTHGDLGNPDGMPLCTSQEISQLSPQNQALVNHPFVDDVAFFDAMVSFLKENYRIAEKAVYVTGFSNGSQMSHRLAFERSHMFAATAGHAGPVRVAVRNGRAISAVLSVGTLDDRFTVPYGVTSFPCAESTLQTSQLFAANLIGPMLDQLNLTQAYAYDEQVVSGRKLCRWTFSTSEVGASNSFQFVLFDGNYHTYPNGSNYPVIMANVLWPFFESQRLP